MGSRKSGWIDNSEAMRWTPTQLAQALAEIHYAVASRSDQFANWDNPMFHATKSTLQLAIQMAYPREVLAWGPDLIEATYAIWVDNGEPIEYCVKGAVDYLTEARGMADLAAARQAREGADASRAGYPGAHSESAGIPTTQDQPPTDPWAHAAPLTHERKRPHRIECQRAMDEEQHASHTWRPAGAAPENPTTYFCPGYWR